MLIDAVSDCIVFEQCTDQGEIWPMCVMEEHGKKRQEFAGANGTLIFNINLLACHRHQ